MDRIANWRERDGTAQFEVKWTGYAEDENTWEPLTSITRFGSRTMFREFASQIDDERQRQLLSRAYGGTGGRRTRRRRRAG